MIRFMIFLSPFKATLNFSQYKFEEKVGSHKSGRPQIAAARVLSVAFTLLCSGQGVPPDRLA